MSPEEMLVSAKALRDVGVLIFERRCWVDETWEHEGKKYRSVHGCGSYFRWMHGTPCACPFCGYNYDYSQKFPYTNPDLWPLTLNYTGNRCELTKEEEEAKTKHYGSTEVVDA